MIHSVKAEIKWRKIHKISSCAWTRKKKKSREGQNPIFSPKDLDLVGWVDRFCGFLLRYYGCRSLRDFSGYRVCRCMVILHWCYPLRPSPQKSPRNRLHLIHSISKVRSGDKVVSRSPFDLLLYAAYMF